MMERRKLSQEEIEKKLNDIDGWGIKEGKLHKDFKFENFVDAFAFMTKAAMAAETMDHHPEWFNVYNKVCVSLSTHDLGGISTFDFDLAAKLDGFAN